MKQIQLNEDAFAALFKPKANHLNSNASFDWGDGCGTLYETFGCELEFVRLQKPEFIWTLVSCDESDVIISGYHFVNRIGYFLTDIPVPDDVDIEVVLEAFA